MSEQTVEQTNRGWRVYQEGCDTLRHTSSSTDVLQAIREAEQISGLPGHILYARPVKAGVSA